MEIEKFDPAADSATTDACYQIRLAVRNADDHAGPSMSARSFGAVLAAGWIGNPGEAWVARDDDGAPAGWYRLELPARDNKHLASLDLMVHPARRRRGVGSRLLAHAAGRAARDGRTLLSGLATVDAPGEAFVKALGATQGITMIRRVRDLTEPVDVAVIAGTAGYSLVSWTGCTPAEHLADVAALIAALEDAPRDENAEPERWDDERVLATDQRLARQGLRPYSVASRHDASGRLAGLTQVGVDSTWAFQEVTAVADPHRGHRLGLRLKLAMQDVLRTAEPELRYIVSWNAEGNDHMVAINEALGYVRLGKPARSWELPVSRVLPQSGRPAQS